MTSHYVNSTAHSYTLSVAYLGMSIWAYEELVSGSNWFRRLLGTAYMITMIAHVAHAIK
jgi:hypothetical protein